VSVSQGRTKLIRRLADRKTRAREAQILVEGVRSVEEALAAELEIRFAVVGPGLEDTARGRDLLDDMRVADIELLAVTDPELASLANTERPQGVVLVCTEPPSWAPTRAGGQFTPILLADGIQDPGNLGTLARTARAFGFAGLVALDGTVDPWNPKCVRAAAGALFHLGVRSAPWAEIAPWLQEEDFRVLAGVGGGVDVASVETGESWALAIGNEGSGVRQEILDHGAEAIAVPMKTGAESLNAAVAGGILMYSLARGTT
jgi:RNA methyltransferase, TrmH family